MNATNNNANNNKPQKILLYGLIGLLITQVTSCAFAPWEKSIDKTKVTDEQLKEAKKAATKEPEGVLARKNLLVTTELATTKLFADAEQAQLKGQYVEALVIYNHVLELLPDEPNALSGKLKVERA